LTKKSGFLDSDDNARGSRITITVVCPISDVQLKIPRKLMAVGGADVVKDFKWSTEDAENIQEQKDEVKY
jgi:hypothetical protein